MGALQSQLEPPSSERINHGLTWEAQCTLQNHEKIEDSLKLSFRLVEQRRVNSTSESRAAAAQQVQLQI
eukprot:4933075-Amphidinium_carterae.1